MPITLRSINVGYPKGSDKSLMINLPQAKNIPWTFPAITYVIEHPAGRILLDTGISPRSPSEWMPEWRQLIDLELVPPDVCLENRLKQLGLGPEDFKYVVMSHLHVDHAGGLRLFEHADVTIVIHENEYRHVRSMQSSAEAFYAKVDFEFLDRARVQLVSDDVVELADGIKLISLPGHTPGTMGMLIRLRQTGWVLIASDALYLHDCYGPPAVGSAMVWDGQEWERSADKIRQLATEHEALIFPGHDEIGIRQLSDRLEYNQIGFWPNMTYE
ncbi:N-acyl homoserine lactonase family protein [Nocardia jejuensis]|uniref:N-acyl homoserine lactonase family protein n=1 Tax=Nocardia jejuensis TaxID=328049 RepID=UPI000A054078|nr:N-acyl homoserine lactonase family protein [Nocardia jejuensis]